MSTNEATQLVHDATMPLVPDTIALAYCLKPMPGGKYTSLVVGQNATPEESLAMSIGDRLQLAEMCNSEIAIRHVSMERALSVDEATGEVQEYMAIRMMTPDGIVISCGAASVARILAGISQAFGPPPWTPPVFVTFITKTKDKKRWYAAKSVRRPGPDGNES